MFVKNLHRLPKNLNEFILTILFLTDITVGKLDLLEKFVWTTISLIILQVWDVFL